MKSVCLVQSSVTYTRKTHANYFSKGNNCVTGKEIYCVAMKSHLAQSINTANQSVSLSHLQRVTRQDN